MKVLNLYAGIGGNRKLWEDVDVTAVELNPKIAEIYKTFFPDDLVIVGDAHQYLLDHYKEFDFIWASPPCPTHSRFNFLSNVQEGKEVKYPDMTLYQEIIFLKTWFKGLYCVENVISYYKPLIPPVESKGHYFWTNFYFKPFQNIKRSLIRNSQIPELQEYHDFDLSDIKVSNKRQVLRNCVDSQLALHILTAAKEHLELSQPKLFEEAINE